ncbi:MAG: peptidoglycan DD-metalloendopeptidase family protein [Thermodesulfobacteriota bacterium]
MNSLYTASIVLLTFIFYGSDSGALKGGNPSVEAPAQTIRATDYRKVAGTIKPGETLFDIFRKNRLDTAALFSMSEASGHIHRLSDVSANRPYSIVLDDLDRVQSFTYWINEDTSLRIARTGEGFYAEKRVVRYERRMEYVGGRIRDNLVSSIGNGRDGLRMALQLSDIFAWDIDFTTDIRNDDSYKVVVEGLYRDGRLKKYGDIIAAEFINNGQLFRAYRYEIDGKWGYYDEQGRSLKKAFLKAPLNFRSISSFFSKRRKHPILKVYRPHHGIDYAAPTGAPVSVAGDGRVLFAGRKGDYGNLVIVRHRNGYKTYYGHLSRIAKGVRAGKEAKQGQIIGFVGSTGLASGPHLHYEMRVNDQPVNPLSVKTPGGTPVPDSRMPDFIRLRSDMHTRLTANQFGGFTLARSGPSAHQQ